MIRLALAITACLLTATADAQWLKEPTAGLPRKADGSPDLAAPAPRTSDGKPDLSGLWRLNADAYSGNVVADLKPEEIQPWADALYKQRMENLGKDDPATFKCLPQGPRAIVGLGWNVGTYELASPVDPKLIMIFNITLSGDALFLDLAGKDKQELISLSDTRFVIMGERMEFVRNERNEVTHFIFHAVEGDLKATKKAADKK
jgi:hypothetical protein